jgi:hypothetical protein
VEGLDASSNQSRIALDVIRADCIYVAASARDARFTRICVASIRYFYPDIPLRILAGGPLEPGLSSELRRYWHVEPADLPSGDYGWGFVKLEPLFGRPGERFLVLDSDTVLAGPVLELWTDSEAQFLVDDEQQSEADTNRLYYNWRKLLDIDPGANPPQFVFNSGQWFGTAGVLKRTDFSPWLNWEMPRQMLLPDIFHCGEQGVYNYVINRKSAAGEIRVNRGKLMRWPAHSMHGLDVRTVARGTTPPLVVHWAGMKKPRLREMKGADLLAFFEAVYYRRMPGGAVRRKFMACRHASGHWLRDARVKARMHIGQFTSRRAPVSGNPAA